MNLELQETTMPPVHPIHTLRETLEAARLELVQKIASEGRLSVEALGQLSIIQGSLTAVREEIDSREPKVGFGAEQPLD